MMQKLFRFPTSFAVPALAVPALALLAFAAGDPLAIDPSHYNLEIQNQWTRVFREHMEAKGKLIMHQHPLPGAIVVYLTDQDVQQTFSDGKVIHRDHKYGEAAWFDATAHESINLANAWYECMQIEPKKPATMLPPLPAEKLDPVTTQPKLFHVEFENDLVRVVRVKVGPNQTVPMYRNPATGAVLVYLTDQDMRKSGADGVWHEEHHKMRSVQWVAKEEAHQDRDTSGKGYELIRIELKQAR